MKITITYKNGNTNTYEINYLHIDQMNIYFTQQYGVNTTYQQRNVVPIRNVKSLVWEVTK